MPSCPSHVRFSFLLGLDLSTPMTPATTIVTMAIPDIEDGEITLHVSLKWH
jgi:hypothetical protein